MTVFPFGSTVLPGDSPENWWSSASPYCGVGLGTPGALEPDALRPCPGVGGVELVAGLRVDGSLVSSALTSIPDAGAPLPSDEGRSKLNGPPRFVITARSITFCSSRTFPGQS